MWPLFLGPSCLCEHAGSPEYLLEFRRYGISHMPKLHVLHWRCLPELELNTALWDGVFTICLEPVCQLDL